MQGCSKDELSSLNIERLSLNTFMVDTCSLLDSLYALSNSSLTSNLTGSIWNSMYGNSNPPIINSWKLKVFNHSSVRIECIESKTKSRKDIVAKMNLYRSAQSEETDVKTKSRCSCVDISSWLPRCGLVVVDWCMYIFFLAP